MATHSIQEFGASSGADTTAAIQRAIDACHSEGGGTVLVPVGLYLARPFSLRGNVTLNLEAGATVKGSASLDDYPEEDGSLSMESGRAGLITALDAENVSITGRGVIDGSGPAFVDASRIHAGRDLDRLYTRQGERFMDPSYGTDHSPLAHGPRPGNLIRFARCRNVLIEGVTIQNSPTWTVHLNSCEDVDLRGVHINSRTSGFRVPNDDGVDVNECRRVRIIGCDVETGDDCLAIFGSEEVVAAGCTLHSRSSGIRVGFVRGDVRDCVFGNMAIRAQRGIVVNVRGEGSVENVLFANLSIRTSLVDGHWWGKGEPINVSALPLREGTALGQIRGLRFSGVQAESEAGIVLYGDEPGLIRDVALSGVSLRVKRGPLSDSYGGNLDFRGTADLSKGLFARDLPGVYAHNVDGLALDGLKLEWADDVPGYFRHGIEVEGFRDVTISRFVGRQPGQSGAAICLRNGEGATIGGSRLTAGADAFLSHERVSGLRVLPDNDTSRARQADA